MQVSIKKFDVGMEVKNNGIELEIRKPSGDFLGDVVLTKTKIIWCEGKRKPANGSALTWEQFREYMNSL
jgi:hypothetical protein